jgi:hypothetical protein
VIGKPPCLHNALVRIGLLCELCGRLGDEIDQAGRAPANWQFYSVIFSHDLRRPGAQRTP